MLSLRNYQGVFCGAIQDALTIYNAILAVSATGSGKTVCVGKLVHDNVGGASVTAHRKEIVAQISLTLGRYGIAHRLIAPADEVARVRREHLAELGRSYVADRSPIGVASVQTLIARARKNDTDVMRWVKQLRLSILDEAHHYVKKGTWGQALDLFEHSKIVGVTATPERADGLGLGAHADGFAEAMIEGPQTEWLIENGFLSNFVYKAPYCDIDLSNIPLTASGDVNTKVLRARIENSHIVGDCVQHYNEHSPEKRAIVFVPDVRTSEETAEAFNRAGIAARSLDGTTPVDERAFAMKEFRAGRLKVLVNVDLFDEGLDVPAVEAVFLMRFTKSLAKYMQMCGRVLRLFTGKDRAVICDMVGCWREHGPFHIRRTWTLDSRESRGSRSASDTIEARLCMSCSQPYEAHRPVCPYCGAGQIITDRSSIKSVDGDLQELDFSILQDMMKKQREAMKSGTEYELELAGRNIPSYGRPRLHKIRNDTLYRRGVLKKLINYWDQAHPPGRSLSEKYRRFYHFFGVDYLTASTLDAKHTDELADVITRRFMESITR